MKKNQSIDDETIVLFTNIFRSIVQNEISSYMKTQNIESFIDLSVKSVASDGLTATLIDLTTKEIYEDIPNHTGIMLKIGDIVRMYQTNHINNNQYIGLTFGNNRTDYLYNYNKEDN